MKIGDKVIYKYVKASLEYTIVEFISDKVRIEALKGSVSIQIPYKDFIVNYIKVGKDGRLIETEEDNQLDWFGQLPDWAQGLPQGQENKQLNCNHEWKEYTGLTDHYLFCSKCDKKENIVK